jgi:hypothetical protein
MPRKSVSAAPPEAASDGAPPAAPGAPQVAHSVEPAGSSTGGGSASQSATRSAGVKPGARRSVHARGPLPPSTPIAETRANEDEEDEEREIGNLEEDFIPAHIREGAAAINAAMAKSPDSADKAALDEELGGMIGTLVDKITLMEAEMKESKIAAAADKEAARAREEMLLKRVQETAARLAQVETEQEQRSADGRSTGSAGRGAAGGGPFFERRTYVFKGLAADPADVADNAAMKEKMTLYTPFKVELTADNNFDLSVMVSFVRSIESFAKENNGKAPAAVRSPKYISAAALSLMDRIAMASTPGGGGTPPMTTMALHGWMTTYIAENGFELATVLPQLPAYVLRAARRST